MMHGEDGDIMMIQDDWSMTWTKLDRYNRKRSAKVIKQLGISDLSRDKRVLDIGCGTGIVLEAMKSMGFSDIQGIEPDEKLSCRDKDIRIARGDCLDLSCVRGRFDIILMLGVLHHLRTFDDMKRCLAGIHGKLSPGGRFYSQEPWKNLLRTLGTRVLLKSPIKRLSPYLLMESRLYEEEERDFLHWLSVERDFTSYAASHGFRVMLEKRDIRNRYVVLERV